MAKKDFSQINTGRVYETIKTATEEPEAEGAAALEVMPGETITGKAEDPGITATTPDYTMPTKKPDEKISPQETPDVLKAQEAQKIGGRRRGRPKKISDAFGPCPRINLALEPPVYAYVNTMSRVCGISITDFINQVLEQHKKTYYQDYLKALEFNEVYMKLFNFKSK